MIVNFFWGDEVIEQKNGKTMIIGLVPDRHLIIPRSYFDEINSTTEPGEKSNYGLDRLAVLINLSDHVGEVKASSQFFNPSGENHGPLTDLGSVTINEGKSHNIILQSQPFPFSEFGTFKLLLHANEMTFESDITISVSVS